MHGVSDLGHLAEGDVVAIQPSGYIRTLYRRGSRHNVLFATDRCNSFCVMCSQPPKRVDDRDRVAEHLRLLDLIDPETTDLCITGGEPTLLGPGFLKVVARAKEALPNTALHVLTNGRMFFYDSLARDLGDIGHPGLTLGIPLYSDLPEEHDFVVQAAGAFDETAIGLQNLARAGVAMELRIVIHRLTYQRLPDLAELIYRNFCFARHVAFMGLELMGFAVSNLDALWIEPTEYQQELSSAVSFLARRGMAVSVYNHPLCLVPQELWPHCRQSISDWKNDYLPVCGSCSVRDRCCGFFESSLRRRVSPNVCPIPTWDGT